MGRVTGVRADMRGHRPSYGRFTIPTLHAAMLRTHLMAIAFPSQFARDASSPEGAGDGRGDDGARDVDGWAEGGVPGHRCSDQRRRGSSDRLPGIIPIVLGGPSVILDAGRKRRFHSETQRIAMGVRYGGCTAAGCDAPLAFCHAHHDEVPWSRDGGTSVEKGRLLCPKHHRLIHDTAFQHSLD